jgi:DNA-binding GntR family transcriptional regulator
LSPSRPESPIRRDSIEDQIYRSLRRQLLEGEYEDGERLVQQVVAERMGTSRIPVRDALKRLEADGLLVKDENGGYYCRAFGLEDVDEVYRLRMLLEPYALRYAVPNLDDDLLQYLHELLLAMDRAVEEQDQERYLDLNREFHMTIYEAGQRPRLVQIIKGLWSGRPLFVAGDLGKTKAVKEHRLIMQAIEKGDAEQAADLLYRHIEGSLKVLRKRLPERGRQ